MLNIPAEVKTLFKTDSVFKNFHVHFPNGENADLNNEDMVSESVSFTESVCSKDVFQFGLSERSQIQFECVGVSNIFGMTIECAIEICVDSLGAEWINANQPDGTEAWLDPQVCTYSGRNMYRVPYGRFIVESCPRSQGAMKHRRVTAYSILDEIVGIDGFIQGAVLPDSQFETSFEALTAYVTGDTSAFTSENIIKGGYLAPDMVYLFDSSGYPIQIHVRYYDEALGMMMIGSGSKRINSGDAYGLEFTNEGDMKYEQVGKEIVKYLDDNGYDFTYDPDGNKVFKSNEEAMRFWLLYLFCPATYIEFAQETVDYTAATYRPYPTKLGKFVPRFRTSGTADGLGVYYLENCTSFRISRATTRDAWASGVTFTTLAEVPLSGTYKASLTMAKRYYADYQPNDVVIKSTGELTDAISFTGKASSSSKRIKWSAATMYSYVNAYDNRDIISGAAELHAKFGRVTRLGDFEYLRISNAEPVAMAPSEYSELWWDEYTVEPIGSIKYAYKDDNLGSNVVSEISIGEGSSEYDMLQNYILQNINASAHFSLVDNVTNLAEYVEYLVTEYFTPNVDVVSFTPAELDAIGLPYIEAGDYLAIDDADGGTVYTYVLSRTISGIQVLTDSIESKGGEVLGNGS